MHRYIFSTILLLSTMGASAAPITVKVYDTDDKHEPRGTIIFKNGPGGLLVKPNLHGLPPGPHGFHIHQNPSCQNGGMAAGGHLDPKQTNMHLGPYGEGHLGDLPVLYVNADGDARSSLIAPHLNIEKIEGRSVVIHAGGDNYTDAPPSGGGGPRIACGIIR